jgi:hypothetical protein
MKNSYQLILLTVLIFFFTFAGAGINIYKQQAIDRTKLPQKVELSRGFQRWINNLKNKGFVIEADEFRLLEKNEIYNSRWLKISSIDEAGKREELQSTLTRNRDIEKIVFSPNDRDFLDYRPIEREGYSEYQVRFYGLKEDKIIDARIVACRPELNCYFDRAYFLDNNVFVISEISRNIDKKEAAENPCGKQESCEYTFKTHVVDLNNNSRSVYVSRPFQAVLENIIPEL